MEFLPKDKKIWCPFDEEWSAFYQLLSEQGYEVERSSLNEGKDIFRYEPEKWDILVSNPPFSKKNEVLKRTFSFQKPFALLLPVNSIQSKTRYQIFENRIQMLCFDGRIDYHTWQNMECYSNKPSIYKFLKQSQNIFLKSLTSSPFCDKILWYCGATGFTVRLGKSVPCEKFQTYADMAELADAYGSGPYVRKNMQVQVLLSAPK